MAMNDATRGLVLQYARDGWFRHIQTVCDQIIRKKGQDPLAIFWKAFGTAGEGALPEAIREVEVIRRKRNMGLPATLALLHFHKRSQMPDQAAIEALKADLDGGMAERAQPGALAIAAAFCAVVGDSEQAVRMADRALHMQADTPEASAARGWALIDLGRQEEAIEVFERLRAQHKAANREDIDTLMGHAAALSANGQLDDAVDALSEAVAAFEWFLAAHGARGRLLAKQGDWDQVEDAVQRMLATDETDIEGLRLLALKHLSRDGRLDQAATRLGQLRRSIEKHEPRNATLCANIAMPFALVACGARRVLEQALEIALLGRRLDTRNVLAAVAVGKLQLLLGRVSQASESFSAASRLDDSNVEAITGSIACLLAQGSIEDAWQQLEMFRLVQKTVGRSAELALLDAQVMWLRDRDVEAHVRALDEARKLHAQAWRVAKRDPLLDVFRTYAALNPDLMSSLAAEYLVHATPGTGKDRSGGGQGEASRRQAMAVRTGLTLLEQVTKAVPGLLGAHLQLARNHLKLGNYADATRSLVSCLSRDPSFSDAHVTMAQVSIAEGKAAAAEASLEQAMSHDFKVRDRAVYKLCKAEALVLQGKHSEAIAALEDTLKLPGVRDGPGEAASGAGAGGAEPAAAAGGGDDDVQLQLHDRATVFVRLAESYTKLGKLRDAKRVVRDATNRFTGTAEEVRVLVVQADVSIAEGDADAAIRMLGNVPVDSPAYAMAQRKRADVYLTHRQDRRMFVQCFLRLRDRMPGRDSLLAVSEAYMRVQMPDEAIGALREALRNEPNDPALLKRLGRVLVLTHRYQEARGHYERILEDELPGPSGAGSRGPGLGARLPNDARAELRADLTELYIQLRQFDDAEQLLDVALQSGRAGETDHISMQSTIRALRSMARVQGRGLKRYDQAISALQRAAQAHRQVLQTLRSGAPELLHDYRQQAAAVQVELGEQLELIEPPRLDEALAAYEEAARLDDSHAGARLALAKLLMRQSQTERAGDVAGQLARLKPDLMEAQLLLTDLMFARGEEEAAAYKLEEIVDTTPSPWPALERLLTTQKYAGRLTSDGARVMAKVEKAMPQNANDPGFQYCKGLFHQYSSEPQKAISAFNLARNSAQWGLAAVERMVQVYVSPDGDDLWHDAGAVASGQGVEEGMQDRAGGGDTPWGASRGPGSQPDAASAQRLTEFASTAQKLLNSIPRDQRRIRHQVLHAYTLIATRAPARLTQAQQALTKVLERHRDNVPALLAIATAFLLEGSTSKARQTLKRISSLPFDSALTPEFVRAWLMLADINIGAGKFDVAQALCDKALQRDRSCARAYEYLGAIFEREAAYADAASNYEKAWQHTNESSPSIGYKLAFNYLKASRFTRAIDICQKVLERDPDYPSIRENVLQRAYTMLRR